MCHSCPDCWSNVAARNRCTNFFTTNKTKYRISFIWFNFEYQCVNCNRCFRMLLVSKWIFLACFSFAFVKLISQNNMCFFFWAVASMNKWSDCVWEFVKIHKKNKNSLNEHCLLTWYFYSTLLYGFLAHKTLAHRSIFYNIGTAFGIICCCTCLSFFESTVLISIHISTESERR